MSRAGQPYDATRHAHPGGILAVSASVAFIFVSSLTAVPLLQSAPPSGDGGSRAMSQETVVRSLSGDYVIENAGQVADGVRFYSMGNPSAGFRDDGVVFVLSDEMKAQDGMESDQVLQHARPALVEAVQRTVSVAYVLRFEGANEVRPVGRDRLPFSSNFFIGSDPATWKTDVPSYREVVYEDLYDGVDLVYRPTGNGVKYEFLLSPGADPRVITLRYDGIESLDVVAGGMAVATAAGEMRDSEPYSYQEGGAEVRCGFSLRDRESYGFDCVGWDGTSPLTIDPLIYSTFLGGSGWDRGYSVKVDGSGSAYVTGQTQSINFPTTPGSYDTTRGGTDDAYVTKLSADGSSLVYSTYVGGGGFDAGLSITLDANGNACIAGDTMSSNFPTTPGAFSRTPHGNFDGFVTKLNSDGNALLFSTYIGGAENDTWPSVAIDAADNVYVTGITESADFPVTPGAFDVSYNSGDSDAFAMNLNSTGMALIYSTFLGGSDADFAYSIAVDTAMNAYVTGGAWSADFPTTPGAFDSSQGGSSDVFVTKIGVTGSSLGYSTFLGGSDYDVGLSIAVDPSGLAYVTGSTVSPNFPMTPGAYDSSFNGGLYDAFITKLNSGGSSLTYSTYFGGGNGEFGNAIAIDSAGNAYITGGTDSDDLPVTPGALDGSYNGLMDAFVTEMNETGFPANSTYLGGSGTEGYLNFLTVNPVGETYLTGITNSTDFPITPGAFDTTVDSNRDGYVTKLGRLFPDLAIGQRDIAFDPPGPVVAGTPVTINATIDNLGSSDAIGVVVRFHDGPPSGSNQIGSDQVIPLVPSPGGNGLASIVWNANPPGMHDICVAADPDNGIAESNEANNQACRAFLVLTTFTLPLTPGHRFVSFPLKPVPDDVAAVLSSLSGCYDYVRWYDALDSNDHWKSYESSRGYNDIRRLDNTMGFWINVTTACDFIVTGFPERVTVLSLHAGWNMVGYPSFNTSYTVADLKAAIGLAGVIVETFDASAAPYYLQRAPDTYTLAAGEGYWIFVPADIDWTVYG